MHFSQSQRWATFHSQPKRPCVTYLAGEQFTFTIDCLSLNSTISVYWSLIVPSKGRNSARPFLWSTSAFRAKKDGVHGKISREKREISCYPSCTLQIDRYTLSIVPQICLRKQHLYQFLQTPTLSEAEGCRDWCSMAAMSERNSPCNISCRTWTLLCNPLLS